VSHYAIVRVQDDGRISSVTPAATYPSLEAAKAAAPDLLAGRRGGGRIAIVQVLEEAVHTSSVRYEKWSEGTKRKLGLA